MEKKKKEKRKMGFMQLCDDEGDKRERDYYPFSSQTYVRLSFIFFVAIIYVLKKG